MPAFLRRAGVPEADAVEEALRRTPPQRTSRHAHYSAYYDDELHDLVGDRARFFVERFGYRSEAA